MLTFLEHFDVNCLVIENVYNFYLFLSSVLVKYMKGISREIKTIIIIIC